MAPNTRVVLSGAYTLNRSIYSRDHGDALDGGNMVETPFSRGVGHTFNMCLFSSKTGTKFTFANSDESMATRYIAPPARYLAPLARTFTRAVAAQRPFFSTGNQDIAKPLLQVRCSRPLHDILVRRAQVRLLHESILSLGGSIRVESEDCD